MKTLKYWIEAMRLRTLPVSVSGVLMAAAWGLLRGTFNAAPAIICLLFAVLAQIASNFANEYFDYKAGRDRAGREGPRRGVTEGEISPSAMKRAVAFTLLMAGCLGLCLVAWGGWWLIAVGAVIGLGVFAYSAGPYPLSTHGWGEAGVVLFFGLVPVNFTYYVMSGGWNLAVFASSVAIGLMGANVLIVNNYRDMADDSAVNKLTLCVRCGRPAMRCLYAADALAAVACLVPLFHALGALSVLIAAVYIPAALRIAVELGRREGASLTPLLGLTAMLMFAVSLAALVWAALL